MTAGTLSKQQTRRSTKKTKPPEAQPPQTLESVFLPAATLHFGNVFDRLPAIADGSIDCVITDPPYGSTDCPWDHKIDLREFWAQMWRVLKPAGTVVSFAAQPFATDLINSARKCFRYELIWFKARKVGFLNSNLQPLRQHELVLIFNRQPKRGTYNPQLVAGKPYRTKPSTPTSVYREQKRKTEHVNLGTRHPTSILQLNDFGGRRVHPTQKPTDLCRWLVRSYSRPGDLVLDPFAGSASTGVACLMEGRRFVGVERDESIFLTASERLRGVHSHETESASR